MHYKAAVWIPDIDDVKARVAEAMAPYSEDTYGDDAYKLPIHWDYFTVGGAWDWNEPIPVRELSDDYHCWALVTPERVVAQDMRNPHWNDKLSYGDNVDLVGNYFLPDPRFQPSLDAFLANKDNCPGYMIRVDYHS